jgi:sugar O-acyltransferase (sialic acid O-acetyltransferase NeuD family)
MTQPQEEPVKTVIIGGGGFAREVADVIDAMNEIHALNELHRSIEFLGYVVDAEYGQPGMLINDKPILGGFDWLRDHVNEVSAVCAIGAPHLRMTLVERARAIGCSFFNVIHPNAVMGYGINLGTGVVICAGNILTNNIRVGDYVQINLACTIGHGAVLRNYATLAPGAHISGNVTLDEGTYVGTGANVIQKRHIGAWSIVGAGAAIIRDVAPNTTVVGVPGRVIETRQPGEYKASV